ncbi:MAG: hypothetical protein VW443_04690 [Pseudomonadales bacterium]
MALGQSIGARKMKEIKCTHSLDCSLIDWHNEQDLVVGVKDNVLTIIKDPNSDEPISYVNAYFRVNSSNWKGDRPLWIVDGGWKERIKKLCFWKSTS